MCSEFSMHFDKCSDEFHYDPSIYTSPKAKFSFAISAGDECKSTSDSDIFAEGELRAVSPKDLFDRNEFQENPPQEAFLPEMNRQCIEDVRQGKPQSPACISAITDKSQFNKFLIHVITKKQLPAKIQNITSKLERAIEDHYYTSVDINPLVNNPGNSYELEINYIDKLTHEPVLDIFFKKPQENVLFHRIHHEYLQPVSSVFSSIDNFLLSQTNNTYPPSCTLMENYVSTYDMKVFPMPRSSNSCRYVLSSHCTKERYFAVIAQPSSNRKTKDIVIYVSDQTVQLQPPTHAGETYRIMHNGKQIEVTHDKPVLLDETTVLYVYLVPVYSKSEMNYLLRVEVEKIGLSLLYDGINTKVEVHPFYKGELCGLCSEFDGEITGEYRGPDQCLYLKSIDFVHSSVTNPDVCQDTVSPSPVPRICVGGEQRSWQRPGHSSSNNEDDSDYTEETGGSGPVERTITVEKRGHTCFSTEPVTVCDEGSQPVKEYSVRVGFHCLPKDGFSARRLLTDSKHRVLTELFGKKIDFTESVRGAKSCSS